MTYRQIFKHRSVWMGFAMLLVVFFHAPYRFTSSILKNIHLFGYGGVDIFVFSSGLGCAFSYFRTNNLYRYMKKRLLRVYPSYILFMLAWIPGYCYFFGQMPPRFMIGNLLGIQHFAISQYAINWYFPFIVLIYFFSPFIIEVIQRVKKIYQFLIIIFVLMLFPVPFYGHIDYIIMAARLPIYAIGVYLALHFDQDQKVSKKMVALLGTALIFGLILLKYFHRTYDYVYLYRFGLWWFPFIFITPGLCFLISWFCEKLSVINLKLSEIITGLLSYIGSISLELYLIHIYFLNVYNKYYPEPEILIASAAILSSFAAAILLKKVSDFLKKILKLQ